MFKSIANKLNSVLVFTDCMHSIDWLIDWPLGDWLTEQMYDQAATWMIRPPPETPTELDQYYFYYRPTFFCQLFWLS